MSVDVVAGALGLTNQPALFNVYTVSSWVSKVMDILFDFRQVVDFVGDCWQLHIY